MILDYDEFDSPIGRLPFAIKPESLQCLPGLIRRIWLCRTAFLRIHLFYSDGSS